MSEPLIEVLAAYAHEAWSRWMKYQGKRGGQTFWDVLPIELAERWARQAKTDYAYLSEEEKKSYRIEARRMLAIVRRAPDPLLELVRAILPRLMARHKAALAEAPKAEEGKS